MRFLASFALITLLLIPARAQTRMKAGAIAFYNLENLFDTINTDGVLDEEFTPDGPNKWTGKRYLEKLDRMAGVISLIGSDDGIQGGPAVIGVSEIENRSVLEDLVARPALAQFGYKVVHYDSPDLRGVDVGLLYQPRYFTVTSTSSVELALYDDDGERIYTRDQLVVSGLFDGEKMHFIVNHWPSRRGGEKASRPRRNAAAALTRSIVDSLENVDPGAKIVVMGDLNDDPVNQSVKEILGGKDHVDNLGKGEMFNCMYPLYKKGIGSLAYRDAWNLFDQIIITSSLIDNKYESYQYYTTRIFNKPFLRQQEGQYKGYPLRTYVGTTYQGGYSDHFPVYIIVVKKTD